MIPTIPVPAPSSMHFFPVRRSGCFGQEVEKADESEKAGEVNEEEEEEEKEGE